MAVIQKIRDKYAKLAGGVIVLSLVGFVLMDATSGGGGGLFSRSTSVAQINGDKIDYTEFEAAISMYEAQIKQQNPEMDIDGNTQAQIRDQVFQQLINDKLMQDIHEKLGITVSKRELDDLLTGVNPDPSVRQAFTNPQTGEFNPQEAAAQIQQIKRNPDMKAQWEAFEQDLIKRRYTSKFNALVNGGIYIPKFIMDDNHTSRNTFAGIEYVQLPYNLIADDKVTVTDDDILKYMQSNKAKYLQKEKARSIEYISLPIIPSKEDSAIILESLVTLKEEFSNTEDNEAFINLNSETPAPSDYFTRQQLESYTLAEEIWNSGVGSVIGPFFDGQSFSLAKIEEKRAFPDSVKCRHILIKTADQGNPTLSEEAAQARIDSIVAQVNAGVPFDSLVQKYSDDQGSLSTGGEYDFALTQKSGISKEFADFIFEGRPGEKKTVKVENPSYSGFHYIEILSQGAPQQVSKIAFVNKSLNVSSTTYNAIYTKASEFVNKARETQDFESTTRSFGLNSVPLTNINENSDNISGLGASRELVKWAYNSKVGDISDIVTIGDNYIIAKLTAILEPGLQPITKENRPALEASVKKIKKAQLLIEKGKGKKSLEQIAQADHQQVNHVDSINFAQGFIPGLGNEPKVTGYAFNKDFKENALSPGIAGNTGVFFLSLKYRITNKEDVQRDLNMERRMLEYSLKGNAASMITNSIKESAEIQDTRSKIYQ